MSAEHCFIDEKYRLTTNFDMFVKTTTLRFASFRRKPESSVFRQM
jgi:hypothetical protein